eukprot:6245126-Karenia_brevis.AAC.1
MVDPAAWGPTDDDAEGGSGGGMPWPCIPTVMDLMALMVMALMWEMAAIWISAPVPTWLTFPSWP